MAKRKLRMLLSYILMFVVFNALSDGQASQIVGDTLNRETASVAPAPGVATPSGSSPDSQTVTCIGNQLKISTNNSTLASVLAAIQKCTGAKIDIPQGASTSRVFDNLGPGPAGEVLASLLASTSFDYVIGYSQADPAKVETVLLMARQDDAPARPLQDNTLTPARLAHPLTHEDGTSAALHAEESPSTATTGPDTAAAKVTPATPVERVAAGADRSTASNRAPVPAGATQVARANSKSTSSYVRFGPDRSTETIGQVGISPKAPIGESRWRDELARFGAGMDTRGERLTNASGSGKAGTMHERLTRYPADASFTRSFHDGGEALGPYLLPAIVQRRMPPGERATIRYENGRLTGDAYGDPMNRYAGSYIPAATQVLRVGSESPQAYPISFGALGEAIWQADLRLEFIVPLSLAIVILLIQMAVRALMKTWMVLLIMPFFAICAIGSIFVMRYNLVVSVLGGVIALFSIYAEAVAFRLFFQEFSHFSNMFQRRRFQSGEAK